MVNVVMLNYTYQIGVLELSSKILLVAIFLLAPYSKQLVGFLVEGRSALLDEGIFEPRNRMTMVIIKCMTLLFLFTSFFLTSTRSYSLYVRIGNVRKTAEYSMVKEHIYNGDTLGLMKTD